MSRYLFVVPPLVGHINPTLAVAEELVRAGHEVAWAGHAGALGSLLVAGRTDLPGARTTTSTPRCRSCRATAAGAQGRGRPQVPLGGFRRARRAGHGAGRRPGHRRLPAGRGHLRSAGHRRTGRRPAGRRAVGHIGHDLGRAGPAAARPAQGGASGSISSWPSFQRDAGITDPVDLRFSDRLVLCFTTTELIGPTCRSPTTTCFTGPAMTARPPSPDFPWHRLDAERPRVLVSLGSLNAEAGKRFFGIASEALGDRCPGDHGGPRRDGRSRRRPARSSPAGCPSSISCPTSTRWCPTPGTTRSWRRWPTGCLRWWRPSATTSPSWPSRSRPPAPPSGCASPGSGPAGAA